MKYILLSCLFLPLALSGQFPATGNTWAVIVGISQYQDEEISDLEYAHLDAQNFRDYLMSAEGGLVPEKHIELWPVFPAASVFFCTRFRHPLPG